MLNDYLPEYIELEPTDIRNCRDRLETYSRTKWANLDTSPNTVLGDLILTPQAYTISAIEEGMRRFMSDLNLGNVANGIIYNCKFTNEYVKNFNPVATEQLRPSGIVRLVFSIDADFSLDNSFRFSISDNIFSLYTPISGDFYILKTGSSPLPNANYAILKDSGSGVFFADVPVIGTGTTSTILAGTAGLVSKDFAELIAVTALCDFNKGSVALTTEEMAKRSREAVYSASMNTKNGAVQYIKNVCPFVSNVSALCNSDMEVLRNYTNNLGMAKGAMDVYVRTDSYKFTEQQVIKASIRINETGTVINADWDYVGQPYFIEALYLAGTPELPIATTITSSPLDPASTSEYCYSSREKLHITVTNNTTVTDTSPFVIKTDSIGNTYVELVVKYKTDPLQPVVADVLEASDYKPVNTDVLVLGFVPVVINQFQIVYTKKAGTIVNLTQAKEDIARYFSSLTYPDVYSDGVINKIMDEAGAGYIKTINVAGAVQFSVADKIFSTLPVPTVNINSTNDLRVYHKDANTAVTVRNIRYLLMEDSIQFKEDNM